MAVAVKVTVVPGGCGAVLSGVRLVSVNGPLTVKVAVTVVLAVRVTVQAPVPLQPPPVQPLKLESLAAVAVRVTAVPLE